MNLKLSGKRYVKGFEDRKSKRKFVTKLCFPKKK